MTGHGEAVDWRHSDIPFDGILAAIRDYQAEHDWHEYPAAVALPATFLNDGEPATTVWGIPIVIDGSLGGGSFEVRGQDPKVFEPGGGRGVTHINLDELEQTLSETTASQSSWSKNEEQR